MKQLYVQDPDFRAPLLGTKMTARQILQSGQRCCAIDRMRANAPTVPSSGIIVATA